MANNRMWLIYKPTGHAVLLAKRMGDGWYQMDGDTLGPRMGAFLEVVDEQQCLARVLCNGGQDGFALGLEIAGDNPHSFNGWRYGPPEVPPTKVRKPLLDDSPVDTA